MRRAITLLAGTVALLPAVGLAQTRPAPDPSTVHTLYPPNDPQFDTGRGIMRNEVFVIPGTGTIYTFTLVDRTWTPAGTLFINHPGFARSVHFDGTSIIVGADGAAFIFERKKDGVWHNVATLLSPTADPAFGRAVAIAGTLAAVDGERYERVDGEWKPEAVRQP